MSSSLTIKQQAFVGAMRRDAESSKWGFEALLDVPNFGQFFEALSEAGLFAAANNPAPVPTADGKYWSIPYWPALDYLHKCAKVSGETNQTELAGKVLAVVKDVTAAVERAGGKPDNYHTFRKFAEIIGVVPLVTVHDEVICLLPTWLNSRFDSGLVISALDVGYVRRALISDNPSDWARAGDVLAHCTAIRWVEDNQAGVGARKVQSVADDYWLKELLTHHATAFGKRIGARASELLLNRTREVFGSDGSGLSSSFYRAAVEDHEQNREWRKIENGFVDASRDVLVSWVDQDPGEGGKHVRDLVEDEAEIVRRIAIYVLNDKWPLLRHHYLDVLGSKLFSYGHLHELYSLLKRRFSSFTDQEKQQTVQSIQQLNPPQRAQNRDKSLRRMQRQWLSAIVGQGYRPADDWYAQLNSDPELGELSEHPDFSVYSETRSGFGPAPFSPAELVGFAEDGSLVTRVNSFREKDSWNGPTIRSLADAVTEAVMLSPVVFTDTLPALLQAKRPYQYGAIEGFKRLWDSDDERHKRVDWDRMWHALIDHFEVLLGDEAFWGDEERLSSEILTPQRDWIVALIADFLAAGTKRDDKAFAPTLLQRSRRLILILLRRAQGSEAPSDDPMTQAINTNKGKAIEALIQHALRECRLADRANGGNHETTWRKLSLPFDEELTKCRNANYDFSTLCGAFLANLEYLSREWLAKSVESIFPREYEGNFLSALGGLAYAPARRSSYLLLNEKGLIEHALRLPTKERQTRERLVERVALAYLLGDESLDSPRVTLFFERGWIEDLQDISDFFWSLKDQKLDETQEARILAFLRKCLQLAEGMNPLPETLLSHLSRLIVFVQVVGREEAHWLCMLASYVGREFFAYEFAEQLDRLLPQNPPAVAEALQRMVGAGIPISDYENRVKTLLLALAEHGQRSAAIRMADQMRAIRGMPEVFQELAGK